MDMREHRRRVRRDAACSLFSLLAPKIALLTLIGSLTACGGGELSDTLHTIADNLDNVDLEQTITPLQIDIVTPSDYELDVLRAGETPYIDRDYTYTDIPPAYADLCFVRTRMDDKFSSGMGSVSLNVSKPVTVYVGYDTRLELPTWLQSWDNTGDQLGIDALKYLPLQLYAKEFPAGSVELGGNEFGQAMYVVVVEDPEAADSSPCATPSAATVTFSWLPNTDYVSGYRVYYGSAAASTEHLIADVGLTATDFDPAEPSAIFDAGKDLGAYVGESACFSVSAYDDTGESAKSVPICTTL